MYKTSIERSYSRSEIKRAGRILSGVVQRTPEVEDAFRVAHNWRLHHAYPMVRERANLTRWVKPFGGITAGRLKRMSSIRKKLARGTARLEQMQDLVGCRAVLENMDDLREVQSKYEPHAEDGRLRRLNDYIAKPKLDGYRSVHLILKFVGRGIGEKHAGCSVELQLRTSLQHAWATTVEAVGSMRDEDLKGGEGDSKWRRFLALMSGHIAELEGQPRGTHLTSRYIDLRNEANELAAQLSVDSNLSTYRAFMNQAEESGGFYNSMYLLKMDVESGDIHVGSKWRDVFDFDDLDDDVGEGKQSLEVSVDSMEALRQAYPNYFMDTQKFLDILREMSKGQAFGFGGAKKNSIDRLDLSFLPKDVAKPTKPKRFWLEYTGKAYWGDDPVGTWEKGVFGTYYFQLTGDFGSFFIADDGEAELIDMMTDYFENRGRSAEK